MKKLLPACMVAAALLNSCSLLERNSDDADNGRAARIAQQRDEENAPPFAPEKDAKVEDPSGSAPASAGPATEASPSYEAEIARMSTKIAALETKVDVLTSNLEKAQLKNSQPVIQGERGAQKSMAAPVEEGTEGESMAGAGKLPGAVKAVDAPSSAVEKDFRNAMDLFQAGQNLEASNHFAAVAKKYPRHLLAAHSLYWAGEAAYRGQQWAVAQDNWNELKESYPHSTYMPEALAGLAHVSEKEGNAGKAREYKSALMHSFPKSPVALAFNDSSVGAYAAPASSPAPAENEAPPRAQANEAAEEAAPVFHESSNGVGEPASESEAAGE